MIYRDPNIAFEVRDRFRGANGLLEYSVHLPSYQYITKNKTDIGQRIHPHSLDQKEKKRSLYEDKNRSRGRDDDRLLTLRRKVDKGQLLSQSEKDMLERDGTDAARSIIDAHQRTNERAPYRGFTLSPLKALIRSL